MVVPTLKVVIFVAAHLAITELDKGEYFHTVIHQRYIQRAIKKAALTLVRLKNRSANEEQAAKSSFLLPLLTISISWKKLHVHTCSITHFESSI